MNFKDDYRSCPDNAWKTLKCSYIRVWCDLLAVVTSRSSRLNKPRPAFSLHPSCRRNELLNNRFERLLGISVWTSSLCCYITVSQIRHGRLPCTFLTWQLSDCWRIIYSCSHVVWTGSGLVQKKKLDWETAALCTVLLYSSDWIKVTLWKPQEGQSFISL